MAMKRAVLLPFPGDPFLLNYWLTLYEQIWGDEADLLVVGHNSAIQDDVREYIANRCLGLKKKCMFVDVKTQVEHGAMIDLMLEKLEPEIESVMLVEDDGFVFAKGTVDQCFKTIEGEHFDIVGGKRGSCSMEILQAAKNKWALSYEGYGDQGPNFWPCFFFCKKQLLLDTDRNFGARTWYKGERIEAIDYVVEPELVNGDTFVNTSLQLRVKVPKDRIVCLPQNHGHPDDLTYYEKHIDLFDGEAKWCHIGSLSSGIGGVLMDAQGRALSRKKSDQPKDSAKLGNWCNTAEERKEWERRVQWWYTFWQHREKGEIEEFAAEYHQAIMRVIEQYSLSMKNIERRQEAYKSIGLL